MTPTEKAYMRGIEVADRMLSGGIPILGVRAALDGQSYTVFLPDTEVVFALDTNIMTALATVQAQQRGETVTHV